MKNNRLSPRVSAALGLGVKTDSFKPSAVDTKDDKIKPDPKAETEAQSPDMAEGGTPEIDASTEGAEAEAEAEEAETEASAGEAEASEEADNSGLVGYLKDDIAGLRKELSEANAQLQAATSENESLQTQAENLQSNVDALSGVCRQSITRMSTAVGREVVNLKTMKADELASTFSSMNTRLEEMYPSCTVSEGGEAQAAEQQSDEPAAYNVSRLTKMR